MTSSGTTSKAFINNAGPNFIQSRIIDGENTSDPLYGDWLHNEFLVSIHPPNYPPEPVDFPALTFTTQGIVVMCIPNLLQPPHLRGTNSVYCWSKTSTESTSNPQQEIAKAIVTQYQQCMPKMALAARVNPTINDFKNSLSKIKLQNSSVRTLFHYASHGGPDVSSQYIMLHSPDKQSFDHFPIESVLTATDSCSVHILDCDNAGALINAYRSFISDKADSGIKMDLFAFFACGSRERLPRSPDLPHDVFTSCMTTPARIALLWHSRHYYCFKNGPLRPLNTDLFKSSPNSILDDISLILHRLVEAMAFEVFPPDLFMRVFRTDSSIAHLAANYFLACRMLSFFGVQPKSIPEMPDVSNHSLWHTFDLRLDVALQQLHSPAPDPSLSYTVFLEQSLKTLKHLMNVSTKDISFPGQLTLIPPALTTPSLQAEGSKVLALYIDKSISAVRQMWYFPIAVPLFQMLTSPSCNEYLLLAVAKTLCFMPSARAILREISKETFKTVLSPLLKQENSVFALVIATIYHFENNEAISQLVQNDWSSTILSLFDDSHTDVRLWTLLFVATFVNYIPDRDLMMKTAAKITNLSSDYSPEVRIASLHALCSLIKCDIETEIVKVAKELVHDPNSSVRCELIILLSNATKANPKLLENKDVQLSLVELACDPHPLVKRLMENFTQSVYPSFILQWFSRAILSPIKSLLTDDKLRLSNVQPTISLPARQPNKSMITIGRATSFRLLQTHSVCSSNFTSLFDGNAALFGSNSGEIVYAQWDANVQRSVRISNKQIKHVQCISNSGYPLIISSDSHSNLRFLNSDLQTITAFKLNQNHSLFEFLESDRKLLTFSTLQKNILVYDMKSEKISQTIDSIGDNIQCVRALNHLNDVVAVVSDKKLNFVDLRTNSNVISSPDGLSLFDVAQLDKSANLFAIAHKCGTVSLFDARFNEPIKRYQASPESSPILSFAVQSESGACAIGSSKGVCVIDILGGKRIEYNSVPSLLFSRNLEAVNACCFSPTKFSLAVLQGQSDILFLDDAS
ncbi:hypothetical protein TVAG_432270 [Trichomonas vaginalis G3]|uniref:Raptor N-terminal CASPase-like domain-containing protein n=1 Tax=Trichomonas vaginalis (strain ATCC PRA-98 / G3) TaxID=412133 RepID=A2F8U1_TRIV3|nr:TOR signaling [Trichomonas vaginalis G3]EAX98677.1 hypothetical protein TVAG_432270 [Trichomonas vaginalis G3]KAI5545808.1 TOR signaling [Trichomonas vaginalis G3]|eukprot:XP_001311607.1 hypothetical protein [Trichomonas vaginalis G3]